MITANSQRQGRARGTERRAQRWWPRKLPLLVDSDNWTFLAGYLAGGTSDEEVAVH